MLIIGEGEQRETLKKIISTNNMQNFIHLLGYKKNPYKYIFNAEALIYPQTMRIQVLQFMKVFF